jgi:hypothetical protein
MSHWHITETYKGLINLSIEALKTLALVNGGAAIALPIPSRYVIGPDGVIGYAEINPDYTRRPDPEELLPALRRLRSARAA